MKVKGFSWAKNFAIVGGVFSTVECFIEAKRGRHDSTNSVTAGCITGAALSAKSGAAVSVWRLCRCLFLVLKKFPRPQPSPMQGMCIGCAGFAAFSVVIDKVMEPEL